MRSATQMIQDLNPGAFAQSPGCFQCRVTLRKPICTLAPNGLVSRNWPSAWKFCSTLRVGQVQKTLVWSVQIIGVWDIFTKSSPTSQNTRPIFCWPVFLLKHLRLLAIYRPSIASVAQSPAHPVWCRLWTHDPLSQLVPGMNAKTEPILLAQWDHGRGCQPQSMASMAPRESYHPKSVDSSSTFWSGFSTFQAWLKLHLAPNAPIHGCGGTRQITNHKDWFMMEQMSMGQNPLPLVIPQIRGK